MMASHAISKLPPVGTELKTVLDGLHSHSLYAPTTDPRLIPVDTGALASGSQISSRTALLLRSSSTVRRR